MDKENIVGLSNAEIVRIAAEAGAKAALEAFEKEKIKLRRTQHDRKLRNTKLLLRNYRMFRAHAENAVFELQDLSEQESALDILELMMDSQTDNTLFVDSIRKSIARTQIIVQHITDMLELYHVYCMQSQKPEDARRYDVISKLYIICDAPMTASQVAESAGIDNRTVYKDIDAAVEKLSALIFGIDGIQCI